jgi:outer membrane receptor protein involved in Fe transport
VLIHNLDLRWEWYPSSDTNLSFALFSKFLIDPIETILVNMAGNQNKVTYENSQEASVYGLELEFQQSFRFVHRRLADLAFAGNGSLINSNIVLAEQEGLTHQNLTSQTRPLQGVSPFAVNLSLTYDNPDIGNTSALLYNVIGERINFLGTGGAPDIYEQPSHRLDLVITQRIWPRIELGFKAKNLLAARQLTKQSDKEILNRKVPREFSLALKIDY